MPIATGNAPDVYYGQSYYDNASKPLEFNPSREAREAVVGSPDQIGGEMGPAGTSNRGGTCKMQFEEAVDFLDNEIPEGKFYTRGDFLDMANDLRQPLDVRNAATRIAFSSDAEFKSLDTRSRIGGADGFVSRGDMNAPPPMAVISPSESIFPPNRDQI